MRSFNRFGITGLALAAMVASFMFASCSEQQPEVSIPTRAARPVAEAQNQTEEDIDDTEESDPAEESELYMATDDLDFSNFVFVGDSRTVGMGQHLHLNTIAEVGVGYSFLAAHRSEILELTDTNIVFNLGVNDLAHIDDYIEFFQRLPEEFCFDNHIYVVSVNPTCGDYQSMNADIDYFNVQLSDSLPSTCKWIDTCSFLRDAGFGSPDGLHYNAQTYEMIANLIYNDVLLYQSLGY